MMKHSIFKTLLATAVSFSLTSVWFAPRAFADGGGGSACLFSLDRSSPSVAGHSPADLFVDLPGTGSPLKAALTAEALGLSTTANIDALSSGRDTGIPAMINLGNPMNFEDIRYQFSTGRHSVDNVYGFIQIPLENAVLTYVTRTTDFADQFAADDQAADIFDNVYDQALIANTIGRLNSVAVHQQKLDLKGAPLPAHQIDNIDAFKSEGSFGGYDLDKNGQLDQGKYIFISVDDETGGSMNAATVYVNTGTNSAGGEGWKVYATPEQLGITSEDDVDGLSVWDVPDASGKLGTFNAGDGIVFSLRAGSPSLPIVIAGIPIDQGGIFLARVGQSLVGLPGSYFSLSPGDELDEIYAIDPRNATPLCKALTARPVQPSGAAALSPSLMKLDLDPTSPLPDCAQFTVELSDTRRSPDLGGISSYRIDAQTVDQSIARVSSSGITRRESAPLVGQNLCLGKIRVCALRPGFTKLIVKLTLKFQSRRVERQVIEAAIKVEDAARQGGRN
ncbi:MAG: hypothetical protein AB1631_16110 [Acidobacteriota bacterium]